MYFISQIRLVCPHPPSLYLLSTIFFEMHSFVLSIVNAPLGIGDTQSNKIDKMYSWSLFHNWRLRYFTDILRYISISISI